jgi:hypothetical protein
MLRLWPNAAPDYGKIGNPITKLLDPRRRRPRGPTCSAWHFDQRIECRCPVTAPVAPDEHEVFRVMATPRRGRSLRLLSVLSGHRWQNMSAPASVRARIEAPFRTPSCWRNVGAASNGVCCGPTLSFSNGVRGLRMMAANFCHRSGGRFSLLNYRRGDALRSKHFAFMLRAPPLTDWRFIASWSRTSMGRFSRESGSPP